jgi:hypothetical protein
MSGGTSGAGGKQRGSPSVAGSVRGGSVMPIHTGTDGSGLATATSGGKAGASKASKSKSSSSKKAAATGDATGKAASSTTAGGSATGARKGGNGGGKSNTGSNKTTNSGNASVAGAGDEAGYDYYPAAEPVRPSQASSRAKPSGGSGSNKRRGRSRWGSRYDIVLFLSETEFRGDDWVRRRWLSLRMGESRFYWISPISTLRLRTCPITDFIFSDIVSPFLPALG